MKKKITEDMFDIDIKINHTRSNKDIIHADESQYCRTYALCSNSCTECCSDTCTSCCTSQCKD